MLDEDADEALERADDGAVEHDGRATRVVLGDVLGAQAPRHTEVDLHGAALPHAADAVFQRVFDLRAVKGALALGYRKIDLGAAQRFLERLFRAVPALVGADALRGPRRHLVDDVGEAEVAIDL